MSDVVGSTEDLDAGRTEAVQGLLSESLGNHTGDNPSPLSSEQLHNLSQKINEILGDSVERDSAPGGQPSQFSNEDGPQIIDISEPVDEESQAHIDSSPPFLEDDLIPLSLLSPGEREWQRRERDRILDLLEEEEYLQQLREEEETERERNDAIKKRKESARVELEQLKAARELQKKMGRALVQHAKGTAPENQHEEDMCAKTQTASLVPKKSVSFADAPAVEGNERENCTAEYQSDWGDVIPGRLRAKSHLPLVSAPQVQPMKTHVVERRPTGTPPSPHRHADSDDEDESTSSAGGISPLAHEDDSSKEVDEYSSSNNGLSDDEQLEEGFDYETAQHHREVALEYYRRRHAIGAEIANVMIGNTLDDNEQHETSPLSRFRADRMAAAYDKSHGPVSTSIGESIIPVSRQKSLRNSVRLGKLENDRLVGEDSGASGSEDETVREVIQMLKTGSIQNAGPNLDTSSVSTIAAPPKSDALELPSIVASSASYGPKPSKFKLARGGGYTETANLQGNHSEDNTESRHAVERKSTRGQRFLDTNEPSQRSRGEFSKQALPMIVDSPSFPTTASTSTTIPLSSLHSTKFGRSQPPIVKSSATQDPMIRSQVFSKEFTSAGGPLSKFVVERKR